MNPANSLCEAMGGGKERVGATAEKQLEDFFHLQKHSFVLFYQVELRSFSGLPLPLQLRWSPELFSPFNHPISRQVRGQVGEKPKDCFQYASHIRDPTCGLPPPQAPLVAYRPGHRLGWPTCWALSRGVWRFRG